jgi:sulfur-oxidizing protein SoxB
MTRCRTGDRQRSLVIASGSNGKFVSRVDLDVRDGAVQGYKYKLIPIFSDVITPDAEIAALIDKVRAPYEAELASELGKTDSCFTAAAISTARSTT